MTAFAALHRPGTPLLLPNAWDGASALALAEQGFAAIGTTSLGVAAAAALPDGEGATRGETLRLARLLGGRPFLLSVDAESGFSDDPAEVAAYARALQDAGATGINLEDGRPDGTLAPADLHAAKITAVKDTAPGLFVNARTDTYWLGGDRAAQTQARLDAYQRAGADGVFVPGLSDLAAIAAVVRDLRVPLNILYRPGGPGVAELAAVGVARVSLGSLLFRAALGAALRCAEEIRAGSAPSVPAEPIPGYAEVQRLTASG
ncbi:isocitrate lyase/phosphoenolpyruvate mutase family protein [Streptacidiphilus sp. EB129]|uniref:isocitrate lyase/PEP mutase family protein n=1 Tax=Streptacidiphilus sp. EB129 TaxID=3156262 RepID=UPI0035183095